MSYYANSRESDVYIYKENFEKIINAIHRDYQYSNDVTSSGPSIKRKTNGVV